MVLNGQTTYTATSIQCEQKLCPAFKMFLYNVKDILLSCKFLWASRCYAMWIVERSSYCVNTTEMPTLTGNFLTESFIEGCGRSMVDLISNVLAFIQFSWCICTLSHNSVESTLHITRRAHIFVTRNTVFYVLWERSIIFHDMPRRWLNCVDLFSLKRLSEVWIHGHGYKIYQYGCSRGFFWENKREGIFWSSIEKSKIVTL